jgi:GTPase SAR1 family protein
MEIIKLTQKELAEWLPTAERGVIVCGLPSVGKTYTMKHWISDYNMRTGPDCLIPQHYGKIKTIDLWEVNRLMRLGIDPFIENINYPENKLPACITTKYNERYNFSIFLDDIGAEQPEIQSFGNRSSAFVDIVIKFYNTRLETQHLYGTTNLTQEQIKTTYGLRVLERLYEMCDIVQLDDINRRHR